MDELKSNVSEAAYTNISQWLDEPKYAEYRDQLTTLINTKKWTALEDAFFKVVEFGTGGRRGTTGVGSNRINRVTIGESAQALCMYARQADPDAPLKGVVIACDTRLSSPELSQYTAAVCAANGFKTYIFDSFRSTPELSFAVRHLNCAVGIVISASHNPPADNGFKAYWSDGGQLVAPHDKGVLSVAETITEINVTDFKSAVANGQIEIIGSDIDDAYIKAVLGVAEGASRELAIVYSPLHGAGQTNVLPVLQAAGFEDIRLVQSQMIPDGNFPTIENGKPNPEEREANDLAVAQLMSEAADIAITNDPDADRIGVVVRHGEVPIYLNGNQSGALAVDYALKQLQQNGKLTDRHYIAKTIVTTDLLQSLADKYGVTCYGNMLIGFKYIGELIHTKETSDETFVIGAEESYGLLKGDYARDKDGAAGALPLAEYAAELKVEGKTLYDRLLELFLEHGLYAERLDNVRCEGASGFEKMQGIMDRLRAQPPTHIGSHRVTAVYDYKTLQRTELSDQSGMPIDCIAGNVFVLEFGDIRRRITIRPSGTEPKLKLYTQWYDDALNDNVEVQFYELQRSLEGLAKEAEGQLLGD